MIYLLGDAICISRVVLLQDRENDGRKDKLFKDFIKTKSNRV